MFTCLDFNRFRLADTSSPAFEKSLSAGTEVPGMHASKLAHTLRTHRTISREWYRKASILHTSIDTSRPLANIDGIEYLVSVSAHP